MQSLQKSLKRHLLECERKSKFTFAKMELYKQIQETRTSEPGEKLGRGQGTLLGPGSHALPLQFARFENKEPQI